MTAIRGLTLAAFAIACTGDGTAADSAIVLDSSPDAAAPLDSATTDGASSVDGPTDAAVADAGASADGPADAAVADAGAFADGPADAAVADAGAPDATRGPWDPDKRLLYIADQEVDDHFELYLADFDDAGPFASRRVSAAPAETFVGGLAWAPDGRSAYYLTQITYSHVGIYFVDLSNPAPGAPQQVNGDFPRTPEGSQLGTLHAEGWSSDSRRILYVSDEVTTGVYEARMVDVSGGVPAPPVRLNDDLPVDRDVVAARWSPDARFVAYTAIQEEGEPFHLYVVDVTGATPGAPIRVDGAPGGDVVGYGDASSFAWSPDGRWLSYIGRIGDESPSIWVVPIGAGSPSAGSALRVGAPFAMYRRGAYEMLWSPTGEWIAYRGDVVAYDVPELFAADMRGSTPAASVSVSGVPAGYVRREPRWSPDGARILFSGDVETAGDLDSYVVDMGAGAPGPMYAINASLVPVENAIGAPNYGWSPDSSRVAFVAGESPTELYIVDVTSLPPGPPRRVNQDLPFYLDVTSYHFPWSLDSRWILYRAREGLGHEVFAVDTSASTWEQLTVNGPMVLNGEVVFTASSDKPWRWTPWADQAFYLADQQTNDRIELWWSDLTGVVQRVNGTLTPYGDVVAFEPAPS